MTITGDKRLVLELQVILSTLCIPSTVEPTTTNTIFAYYDGNTDYYFGEHQSFYDFPQIFIDFYNNLTIII